MHVPAQDHGGSMLVDPGEELRVTVVLCTGPACRRSIRRRVAYPDPASIADECRVFRELSVNFCAGTRAIPPRAHRHHHARCVETRSIDEDVRAARCREPGCGTLVVL